MSEDCTSRSRSSAAFDQADLGGEQVPLPGGGNTWQRFEILSHWAGRDLSLGRLAEGHADALAILAEAGRGPADQDATYGVWAARARTGGTTARRDVDG